MDRHDLADFISDELSTLVIDQDERRRIARSLADSLWLNFVIEEV